jgi:hypothetical protein
MIYTKEDLKTENKLVLEAKHKKMELLIRVTIKMARRMVTECSRGQMAAHTRETSKKVISMVMGFSIIRRRDKCTLGCGKTIKRMEKVCSRGRMVQSMKEIT